VASITRLFIESKRASLAEEVHIILTEVNLHLILLGNFLGQENFAPEKLPIFINNVQNSALRLTALLRSKKLDVKNNTKYFDEIDEIISDIEQCIGKIFDDAFSFISTPNTSLTPILTDSNQLKTILTNVSIIEPILEARNNFVDLEFFISDIDEQLSTVIKEHEQTSDTKLLNMIQLLHSIQSNILEIGKNINVPNVDDWCRITNNIANDMENIMKSISIEIDNVSLKLSLDSFIKIFNQIIPQFKLLSVSYLFKFTLEGYENVNFISCLKNFAYLCFPMLYNFKDSISNV